MSKVRGKKSRGQANAEFLTVLSLCAAALLVSLSIYNNQTLDLNAYRDVMQARYRSLEVCVALSDASYLGDGASVNLTVPEGEIIQMFPSSAMVTFKSATTYCPKPLANSTFSSIGPGSYTITNNGGELGIG